MFCVQIRYEREAKFEVKEVEIGMSGFSKEKAGVKILKYLFHW